jgi:predicted phosphodiesterase
MLSDFEMIVHEFPTGDDVTIIPIADVHLGAQECMEKEFISFIGTVADKPNTYIILCGDLLNNATKSSVSNIYEEVYRPSEAKRMMAKILEPVRDKILCSVTGNHERRSSRDVDDDPNYDILCKLDLEHLYRENMAFVKFQFGDPAKNGENNPTYTIVVTHGAGGGALTSGAVLKGERFGYAIDGMDALIMGHTHKPFTTQPGKIVIDKYNNKVSVKPFKVINMTSWLDYSGYAAAKMLLPSSHCMHTLTLRGTRKEMVVTM